jgi:hypothetical protein
MNSMPFKTFTLRAYVVDDHYDEPRKRMSLEAAFRAWLKNQKFKIETIEVVEVQRGMK